MKRNFSDEERSAMKYTDPVVFITFECPYCSAAVETDDTFVLDDEYQCKSCKKVFWVNEA
jgi:transposase-like protein